ncbi:MAG: DegQ family serine endoprotease [Methylocystis sp.]|uniref:DegQ family serine endoprotease n=1 Tax=Methylocystis sp. TaxID=1911079 RepID=UPI003DA3DC49
MTSAFRRAAIAIAAVTSLWLAGPASAKGPDSLADLSAQVSDAVVNISATQTVETKRKGGGDMPGMGPGSPFDDLFEEYFKRRQGQGAPELPRQRKSSSLGSGFVIDPAGIVITNNHVIADANEVTVIFNDGQKLKAEIIGKDQKVDVAVLRVKPEKPLKAVKFGDSDKARVGDWVLAVGNPFGLGGSVTAGIVSARNRNIDSGPYDNYIQTDASINKGNSGGPLFNMDGEVIGINTAILSPSGGSVGIGFATPSNTVQPVIEQLQQFGETRRGWLGVRIQNVDDAIAETLNLGAVRGALVAGVDDKGPSKPAGVKAGDVIVKFDGKPIRESRDLPKLVAATPVGKDVELVIMRGGKEETKKVKLGRLEDGEKVASREEGKEKSEPTSPASQSALGMELSRLTDDLRARYQIKDSLKNGVLITSVDPSSSAAEKRLQAGEILLEVNQEPVNDPADAVKKIKALKDSGKKTALLIVANGQGDAHFVALPVE